MYFEPSHSDMFKDYFKMRVTAHHWHALIQAGYLGDRSRSPSPVGIQDLVYTSLSKVAPEIRLDLCQNSTYIFHFPFFLPFSCPFFYSLT